MLVPLRITDKVKARVAECITIASEHYGRNFPMPTIEYTLRGRTAGKAWPSENRMNLNSVLLVENEDVYISRTPGHEVAHIIDKAVNGYKYKQSFGRTVRDSHGDGWKAVMRLFGQDPSRCHHFDTARSRNKSPNRTKHVWTCGCGGKEMQLGAKRHAKQKNGTGQYYMRGHTTRRCGDYTHTHNIVGGVKTKVGSQLDRRFVRTLAKTKPAKMPKAGTKMAKAVDFVKRWPNLSRARLINIIMCELEMSHAGAQTYYYKAKKILK